VLRKYILELALGSAIGLIAGMCHVESVQNTTPWYTEPQAQTEQIIIKTVYETEYVETERVYNPDIPIEVQDAAIYYGKKYNICPEFLMAIAFCESSYRADAVNGNCKGLMQINIDAQYERMDELGITEDDLWIPYRNMEVAADYLAELFAEYEDCGVVLMKYNGDSRVWEYAEEGIMSEYATKVLALSTELEEYHEMLLQERGGYIEGK